jgi:hypothetical protein
MRTIGTKQALKVLVLCLRCEGNGNGSGSSGKGDGDSDGEGCHSGSGRSVKTSCAAHSTQLWPPVCLDLPGLTHDLLANDNFDRSQECARG